MALRRTIGSLAIRSASYLHRSTEPSLPLCRRLLPDISLCRPFAAPPSQVKGKSKDDDSVGPRINNDITASFLRIVGDQGHSIVPRHEALQLAARMDMDLVEVDRKSDPPVCKIMDFHKEKYKRDAREKERSKAKSPIALRSGENKEVRFKGKTEIKDLKVKADTITRLLERGYKVKCMAMPTGKEEDLGALLSRLLALIQDVCIVESGPHLDSKHAYVIVRHVKFAGKKAGKTASKAMEDAEKGTRNTASESPITETDSGDKAIKHGLEIEDEAISDHFGKMPIREGSRTNPGEYGSQTSERGVGSKNARSDMEKRENTNQGMSPGQSNRYAARREQSRGDSQGRSPQDPRRNENERRYPANGNQRSPQQDNGPLRRFSQGSIPQDPRRNERGSQVPLNNNQRQFDQPAEPATKSFGIFSAPKPAMPESRKTTNASSNKPANLDSPKSYGIFSSPRRESDKNSS